MGTIFGVPPWQTIEYLTHAERYKKMIKYHFNAEKRQISHQFYSYILKNGFVSMEPWYLYIRRKPWLCRFWYLDEMDEIRHLRLLKITMRIHAVTQLGNRTSPYTLWL